MFSIFAKIGMIQAIAPLVTVVSIYMIDPTTKQAGNYRNNSNSSKDKDGKEKKEADIKSFINEYLPILASQIRPTVTGQ